MAGFGNACAKRVWQRNRKENINRSIFRNIFLFNLGLKSEIGVGG